MLYNSFDKKGDVILQAGKENPSRLACIGRCFLELREYVGFSEACELKLVYLRNKRKHFPLKDDCDSLVFRIRSKIKQT